ncbi:RNA polymerase sigma-70 factor [Chitinophaga sp.]|uniref:RNA polymerase sigma factor n=1 Tax=Chitinophaga sp. TaxID=1869181 RepID=UPI002CDC3A55|nr:RNA polymerase sigma-70 factor [Chitinophaga sp.]HWV67960.1 RNA polymerase sigma-70 factor [Chitinophaga sp.]
MSANQSYREKELLQRLVEGDELAFRRVFEHYRDMVYAKALHFMKDPALAEDILQDVFLQVWRHRGRLEAVQNFQAYLNAISRNMIYSHFRKMANHSILLEKLTDQQEDAPAPDIIAGIEAKELQEALHSALGLLTNQQRKVFELSRLKGLSHMEIATELNMQRETVKKHISDALRTIRGNLHRFPILVQTGILLYLYTR